MKYLFLIIACSLLQFAKGQDSIKVTSMAMGNIRIDTRLADIKHLVAIPDKFDSTEYFQSFRTKINGEEVLIEVYEQYIDGETQHPAVYSIYTESKRFYTPSGIKIGMNKFDIIKKLDGSFLDIMPDWRYAEKGDKRYSIVQLYDQDNGTVLLMYFFENRLYGIRCSLYECC